MTTFLIVLLLGAISYLLDGSKRAKTISKKIVQPKKEIVSEQNDNIKINRSSQRETLEKQAHDILSQREKKVIVDRESEIYNTSIAITKEKMVDDIIFAEILSKPKSKR